MDKPASIHYRCPRCGGHAITEVVEKTGEAGGVLPGLSCPTCAFSYPGGGAPVDASRPVTGCAVCGGREFYAQQDFNRKLGLIIVTGTGFAAFVVMVLAGHLWGLAVLGLVTIIDALLYRRLGVVSVCYLCQSVYRGFPLNGEHQGFYLGNEERFKALRQAWLRSLPI